MQKLKRTIYVFPGVLLALVLVLALFASPVLAVDPITIDGNPTCTNDLVGYDYEFKIDSTPVVGSHDINGDGIDDLFITAVYGDNDENDQYFDWTSTFGIDAILVKGSNNANLYVYQGTDDVGIESFGDTGLHSPVNDKGNIPGLSHVSFCYDYELAVSKTAEGSYDRNITWELSKSVSPDEHTGFIGDGFYSKWTVEATKEVENNNFLVEGTITIHNPSPGEVSFSVSDLIGGSISPTVSCPSNTVAGFDTVVCTYSATGDDGIDGTQSLNEVTVTSNTDGVDGGSATADISFDVTTYGDETVTIDDDRDTTGALFPDDISDSETFQYDEYFTCSTTLGDYTNGVDSDNYPNTATLDGTNTDLESSADVDVTCYIPSISKTADTAYNLYWDWTIEKDVDDNEHHIFVGGAAETSNYDVTVNRSSTENDWRVDGTITINNPAPIPMTLSSVSDTIATFGAVTPDCGGSLVVPANGSLECTYDSGVQNAPNAKPFGNLNTATAILNGFSFEATADVIFGDPDTITDETATVTDTSYGQTRGVWSEDSSNYLWEYSIDFDCSAVTADQYDENGVASYTFENIATVTEDDSGEFDTDSELVTVYCYIPVVSKTADTAYNLYWDWTIEKDVDDNEHHIFAGASETSNYDVTVNRSSTENDWRVDGTITINNPAPIPMTLSSVSDTIATFGAVTPDCGGSLVVPANDSLECTYDSGVQNAPNAKPFGNLNTATVVLNGISYQATADVVFGDPDTITDETATVTDDNQVGSRSVSEADNSNYLWEYSLNFDCSALTANDYDENGVASYTVPNTAKVTEDDSGEFDTDSELVTVYCYIPVVSKTADTAYNLYWDWTIEKDVDDNEHHIFAGASETSNYDVTVNRSSTENDWRVDGTITINNASPLPMNLTSVSDTIATFGAVTPDCGGSLVVPANDSLECTYDSGVQNAPNAKPFGNLNTATVVLNGISYQATADVVFGDPDTITDETATVTDDNQVGSRSVSEADNSNYLWEYSLNFDCSALTANDYDENGVASYTVPNTAKVTEDDSGEFDTDSELVTVYCYIPVVSKTADTAYNLYWDWTIEKDVDDNEHHIFAGASETSNYDVTVNRSSTENDWRVDGTITINNASPLPMNLTSVSDTIATFGAVTPDCGGSLVVPANDSLECTYDSGVQNAPNAKPFGNLNTATVVLNGISYQATADVVFGDPDTITDETATVTDDNQVGSRSVSESDNSNYLWEYSLNFDCSALTANDYDENGVASYTVPNTAKVTEDDSGEFDTDSELVTVYCYIPVVSKTADTAYNLYWDWTIEKDVDDNEHHIFAGASETSNYDVTVNRSSTENDWRVDGTITINNASPLPMNLTSVSDTIATFGAVTPDCGGSLVVPANDSLECTYDSGVQNAPNAKPFGNLNTATVVLNGISYQATADVVFGDPDTITDETATVTDDNQVGSRSVSEADNSNYLWEYSLNFDCSALTANDYDENGVASYTVPNTAKVTEDDSGEFDTDSELVTVYCYIPVVSKTADTAYNLYWDWTIEKDVDDNEHHIFAGASETSNYDVTVNRSSTENDWRVDGTITINNASPLPMNLTSVSDTIATFGAVTPDCGGSLVVPANDSLECTYDSGVQNAPNAKPFGNLNTATVVLNGISYQATADVVFGDPDTITDETATVTDDNQVGSRSVSEADNSNYLWEYSLNFDCSALTANDYDENGVASYTVPNTAKVTEDDSGEFDTDSELVTVYCYIPTIVKDGAGTYDERHEWDVEKTVTPLSQSGYPGDTLSWTWTIEVFEDIFEENFNVSGTITVGNPNPEDALVVPLSDLLSDNSVGVIDASTCNFADGNLTVAAGGSETCDYDALDLGYDDDANAPKKNTAKITLNGIDFTAEADIAYTPNVIRGTATLSDDEIGLTDVAVSGGDVKTGDDSVTCSSSWSDYGADGTYGETVVNWATLTDNGDTEYKDDATTTWLCEAATINLLKLTAGQIDPTREWQFAIFDGPNTGQGSSFLGGQALATDTVFGDADGVLEFGGIALNPTKTYTVCEMNAIPYVGWSQVWSVNGLEVPQFDPHETDPVPEDMGVRCVDFGANTAVPLTTGVTLQLDVNNIPFDGNARTPGYWKNWASCANSNGGQFERATTGDPENEKWTLDEALAEAALDGTPVTIGLLPVVTTEFTETYTVGKGKNKETVTETTTVTACEIGRALLDRRHIMSGDKQGGNVFWGLASHLTAYHLNQAAGAYKSPEAADAAEQAQALLVAIEFDGLTSYRNKDYRNLQAEAGALLAILDAYNNNDL